MKKMRGLLGVIVALFAIAPITIANAATVDSVNVNVTLPSVGSTVTYNSQNYTYTPAVTYSVTNANLGDVIQCMFTENPTTATSDVSFTGEVPANTYFWVGIDLRPKTGDTFDVDHLVVTVNGSSSNVQVGQWFTSAGGMVYAKIKTGSASTTETEKVKVHYENVKVINSFARPEDQTIDKGSRVTEPVLFDGQYNLYNDVDFIFEGWYADAEFKTEFDFDAAINKDTTIYAKFTKVADIEKIIKDKLDAANLSVTSDLTEMEGLDKDKRREQDNTIRTNGTVPEAVNDDIVITNSRWDITNSHNANLIVHYSYKNGLYGNDYKYSLIIKHTDSDKHDAELDEAAKTANNKAIHLPALMDYTKLPSADADENTRLLTEAELIELYKIAVNKIDGVNQFDLVTYDEDSIILSRMARYAAKNALTKNDSVYGIFSGIGFTEFMIPIGADVENNHTAYLNSIKDTVKAFLESKGYTDILFDKENENDYVDNNFLLTVYYGEPNERGDRENITFYMMKDDHTFLMAKNLTISFTDFALNEVWAYSYSEDKDIMDEETIADIESMKSTLEGEGYDFFDGYDVMSFISNGDKLTLTFTVGTANNNRRFKVLHTLADGTVEKFTGIVKDGQFSIDVTETSPFAVGLGEVVKATKNNPQTFDPIILSVLMLALSAIGLIGGSIYLTKSRLN